MLTVQKRFTNKISTYVTFRGIASRWHDIDTFFKTNLLASWVFTRLYRHKPNNVIRNTRQTVKNNTRIKASENSTTGNYTLLIHNFTSSILKSHTCEIFICSNEYKQWCGAKWWIIFFLFDLSQIFLCHSCGMWFRFVLCNKWEKNRFISTNTDVAKDPENYYKMRCIIVFP